MRNYHLREALTCEKAKFFSAVSDAKPYLDYVTLLGINATLGALFNFSMTSMVKNGPSGDSVFGAIALMTLFWILWKHLMRTHEAIASVAVVKLATILRLPFPGHDLRSASMQWFYSAFSLLITWGAIFGTGFIGYQFAHRTIEAFTHRQAQSEPAKPPAKSEERKAVPESIDPASWPLPMSRVGNPRVTY